jgi:NAD(P)-dependent dehydrogenase (short-subunit alcohol dehydrogenase family)
MRSGHAGGRDEEQVRAAAAAVDERWLAGWTRLISNAGWLPPATPVLDLDVTTLRRVIDVNLVGCFLTTRHFARGRGAVRRVPVQRCGQPPVRHPAADPPRQRLNPAAVAGRRCSPRRAPAGVRLTPAGCT